MFRIRAMSRPSYALASFRFGASISRNAFVGPLGATREHPAWIITHDKIVNTCKRDLFNRGQGVLMPSLYV